MTLAKAQVIELTDMNYGNGFTLIQLNDTQIIQNYNHLIHIVNLTEYEINILALESTVLKNSESSHELSNQLSNLKAKFQSIIPHNRNRRGLINAIGITWKWLFGTMDDDDAQEIQKCIQTIGANNRNLIQQSNRQIVINDSFNSNFKSITDKVNKESKEILEKLNSFGNNLNRLEKEFLQYKFESQVKENINYMINDIQKIKEIMLSARLGILNRNILTIEEMEKNKITIENIQLIELKIAISNYNFLFIICIPQ